MPINRRLPFLVFPHLHLQSPSKKEKLLNFFSSMVEHFSCGTSGPNWQFSRSHWMTRGDSPMAPPSTLGRPPEFLIKGAEELAEQETAMTELEVKDMEFEEDRVEVA